MYRCTPTVARTVFLFNDPAYRYGVCFPYSRDVHTIRSVLGVATTTAPGERDASTWVQESSFL